MQESNLLMYTTEDGLTKIEATFVNDTVWLSIEEMAELFQRDRSVIGKHIRNIFKEGELKKESVWAIFAMKHSKKISENLEECFWYNGDKKENLITDFSDIRKIRITDAKSGEGLRE